MDQASKALEKAKYCQVVTHRHCVRKAGDPTQWECQVCDSVQVEGRDWYLLGCREVTQPIKR